LRRLAERLRAEMRPGDLLARLGGEEFLVAIRRCRWRNRAMDCAERLRRRIGEAPFFRSGMAAADRRHDVRRAGPVGRPGMETPEQARAGRCGALQRQVAGARPGHRRRRCVRRLTRPRFSGRRPPVPPARRRSVALQPVGHQRPFSPRSCLPACPEARRAPAPEARPPPRGTGPAHGPPPRAVEGLASSACRTASRLRPISARLRRNSSCRSRSGGECRHAPRAASARRRARGRACGSPAPPRGRGGSAPRPRPGPPPAG
jgi:hypothetical protein